MNRRQQEVIAYLVEENRILREHVGPGRLKFTDDQRRRLAAKAKKLGRQTLEEVATIAAPETLMTWRRNLIAKNYAGGPRRRPGRPPTRPEIAALAVRMAEENRSWGYRRIQGALDNLGYDVANNTVRNILKRHGIEPAPERPRQTTWKEFRERHWEQIVVSKWSSMDRPRGLSLARLVSHGCLKLLVSRVDIAGAACRRRVTQIARQVTHEIHESNKRMSDLAAEERRRTGCHAHIERYEPAVGLIVPFSAFDRIGLRVKRPQRRDRLLNDQQCEAA
jgi:putative transposase